MKNKYKNRFKYIVLLSCSIQCMICFTSCEGFVEIDPPITDIVRENVFNNDITARAAISGIYSDMFNKRTLINTLTLENGLYTDELNDLTGRDVFLDFFNNTLLPDNNIVYGIWSEIYKHINAANAIIEGVEASAEITPSLKDQLKGEALFIRAYGYFFLVNLWGDVPLVMSTDFRVNSLAPRDPAADVYGQIITDLMEAQTLLAEDYSFSGGERGRPNRAVASALLARAYLYKEDWANAEIQASNVINNGQYDLLDDLNGIFLINSAEAIWQLRSTFSEGGINTFDAETFIIGGAEDFSLRDELINDFEAGDLRLANWVGTFDDGSQIFHYPFKYKVVARAGSPPITEAQTLFRLAEQYLIRAEARVQQNNISGAQEDLNRIRNRAGLGNTTAATKEDLLLAIEQERKVELFTESSHRWFDLKRTGRAGAVLSALKPGWQSTDLLYPVPEQELNVNPNLTQNDGY